MNSYPRESVEFCALDVKVDGVSVTTFDVQVTVVPNRPDTSAWQASIQLDGKSGFIVQNLTPGMHRIWVRVSDNPETPVLDIDSIYIS